jgi:protein-disulfide isomerase
MKSHRIITGFVSAFLFARSASAQPACPALDKGARVKLADYVHKKYRLAADVQLDITESSFVEETCYRNLVFKSHDSPRPFKVELIASPDFRFLTRELLDSTIDPAEEVRRQARVTAAKLTADDAASLGPKDAPVTLVLFSDFQCPFCSQMASGLMRDILPADGGKIRLIFRNFPLSMHPWARAAAEAAACARVQSDDYFWLLHDYIFAHQREVTADNLELKLLQRAATIEGFDPVRFKTCIDRKESVARIDRDLTLGSQMTINSTPTLFINGQRVAGYREEEIRTLIREQMTSEAVVK